ETAEPDKADKRTRPVGQYSDFGGPWGSNLRVKVPVSRGKTDPPHASAESRQLSSGFQRSFYWRLSSPITFRLASRSKVLLPLREPGWRASLTRASGVLYERGIFSSYTTNLPSSS